MPDTPETVLDVRMSLEALLAGEATIDETVSDLVRLTRTPSSASEVSELVERLRAVDSSGDELGDGEDYGVTCSYRNPDGPEAATALETLEARVRVLTALIEKQLRQKASAAWDIEARALLKQLSGDGE